MSEKETVLRLAKPKKKGLLRFIFSRLFLILVLLALQVLLFAALYGWFKEYIPHFTVFQIVFTISMVLYLFNNDMDSSAKLTWLILIALFPIPGAIFLAYTQTNIGHRAVKRRIADLISETKSAIAQDGAVLETLANDNSGTDDLHRYCNRSGCFPICANTEARYFPQGEDKFAAMLDELEKAEQFIYMEYFIIEEGYMWGRILDVLARKAKAGVDVRVLYDGMCEITTLPHDYPKRLRELGIQAKMFSPVTPFLSTHYNYRDHRKILVIDNKVAFNGGVNLADEYINRRERFGHWKDTAVMLRGEAVRSFTLMFLQMWNIDVSEADFSAVDTPTEPVNAPGYVMPYCDEPLDNDKVGESVYIDMLCLFDENEFVLVACRDVIVDVPQEARRVAVGEVVVGADQQRVRVRDLFALGKVTIRLHKHVVENSRELPVVRRVRDALHPAHERERQHFISIAALHLFTDDLLLPLRDAGHHVGEIRGTEQQKMLHARVVIAGKIVNDLVRAQRVSRKNDMLVTRALGVVEVRADVLVGVGKPLVP